jgi:acetoin utilization protein AcuC
MKRKVTIVHSPEYAKWDFSGKARVLEPRLATKEELMRVHGHGYVKQICDEYICDAWEGKSKDLANLATLFVGGTLVALEALLDKSADVAIHLPGAIQHAQPEKSPGFSIFNDCAIAADIASKDYGLKVAIIDIGANYGDGAEDPTRLNPDVLTFSIHQSDINNRGGDKSEPENHVFNYPLIDEIVGLGDTAILAGVNKFLPIARHFQPDLLFLVCGADGLKTNLAAKLEFSLSGFQSAARLLRETFLMTPTLMVGAGGFLLNSRTPKAWARVAKELAGPAHV